MRALTTRVPSIPRLHIIYGGVETLDIACLDRRYTLDIAYDRTETEQEGNFGRGKSDVV